RYRIGLVGMSRRATRFRIAWRNARQRAARYRARLTTANARVAELEQALADADATQLHTDGACEAVQRAETAEAARDRVRDIADQIALGGPWGRGTAQAIRDALDGPARPGPQS
ncbi:hypothetical protein, partial [Streptomyces fradiae]